MWPSDYFLFLHECVKVEDIFFSSHEWNVVCALKKWGVLFFPPLFSSSFAPIAGKRFKGGDGHRTFTEICFHYPGRRVKMNTKSVFFLPMKMSSGPTGN